MHVKGKKIGVASTAAHFSNTIVLKEIERLITGGAELVMIVVELSAARQDNRNPLKELLLQLAVPGEDKILQNTSLLYSVKDDGGGDTLFPTPQLDLLVIISGFQGLLESLARLTTEECSSIPLVLLLIPSPGEKPAYPQISSLLEKKGVFFVPFGPLSSNREHEGGDPSFCSRIDLLGDACSAALQGKQLRPFVWDNYHFPN